MARVSHNGESCLINSVISNQPLNPKRHAQIFPDQAEDMWDGDGNYIYGGGSSRKTTVTRQTFGARSGAHSGSLRRGGGRPARSACGVMAAQATLQADSGELERVRPYRVPMILGPALLQDRTAVRVLNFE